MPTESAAPGVLLKALSKVILKTDGQHIPGKAQWENVLQPRQMINQSHCHLSHLRLFPVGHPHCTSSPAASGSVINGGQPEGHVGTGAGKGHELGVELQTGNGTGVFTIQHSYFYTTLSIPDMDLAIF